VNYITETIAQQRTDDVLHQRAELRDFAERKGTYRIARIAAIHSDAALNAAWEADLSGVPMTWIGSK
jgi:hypothetical protein